MAPTGWTRTLPTAGATASVNIYQATGTYDNCADSTSWTLDTTSGLATLLLPACPTQTALAGASGTIVVTSSGSTWGSTGDIINGVIYGFFPQSGASGSGLFTGTISGSSGGSTGSSGLVLTTSTTTAASGGFGFASGSGSTVTAISTTSGANVLVGGLNYSVIKQSGRINLLCN